MHLTAKHIIGLYTLSYEQYTQKNAFSPLGAHGANLIFYYFYYIIGNSNTFHFIPKKLPPIQGIPENAVFPCKILPFPRLSRRCPLPNKNYFRSASFICYPLFPYLGVPVNCILSLFYAVDQWVSFNEKMDPRYSSTVLCGKRPNFWLVGFALGYTGRDIMNFSIFELPFILYQEPPLEWLPFHYHVFKSKGPSYCNIPSFYEFLSKKTVQNYD